ncbi:MAG TPA: hypothetical protein PLI95_09690 [Polyangiaceae bacterium]|nr:hypothetical protein [Polyangiaceae bacterium]
MRAEHRTSIATLTLGLLAPASPMALTAASIAIPAALCRTRVLGAVASRLGTGTRGAIPSRIRTGTRGAIPPRLGTGTRGAIPPRLVPIALGLTRPVLRRTGLGRGVGARGLRARLRALRRAVVGRGGRIAAIVATMAASAARLVSTPIGSVRLSGIVG